MRSMLRAALVSLAFIAPIAEAQVSQTFPSQLRTPAERIIGPLTIPAKPKNGVLQANIDPTDAANPANALEMVAETSSDGFVNDIHENAKVTWHGNTIVKGALLTSPRLAVSTEPEQAGQEIRFRVTNNNPMTFGGALTVTPGS